jgi:TRAP-type mannitol/chloroaromatic compound transport system substrate-binding protein
MKATARLLALAMIAALAVSLFTVSANAKVIRWKMTSTWPPSINLIDCDQMFVETVNQMCKDRLEIKFFSGGTLMPSYEVFDAVGKGTVEAAGDWPNYWAGKDTVFDTLGSYPMGLTPFDYLVWYHYGGGKAIFEEAYGKFNMMYIVTGMTTMESGIRSNKPIKTLEDLKGMKIRMSGKTQGKILQDLGAAQVAMAGQEIYQALQKGVVDAAEFSSPSTDWGMGFQEVTKYWAVPGWHQPASTLGVMINKDAWDALDDDLKQMVQYAAYATQIRFISKQYFDTIEYVQKFIDKGIQISHYDPAVLDRIEELTKKHCEESARENPLFKKSMQSQITFRKGLSKWREMEEPFSFGFNPKNYPELD